MSWISFFENSFKQVFRRSSRNRWWNLNQLCRSSRVIRNRFDRKSKLTNFSNPGYGVSSCSSSEFKINWYSSLLNSSTIDIFKIPSRTSGSWLRSMSLTNSKRTVTFLGDAPNATFLSWFALIPETVNSLKPVIQPSVTCSILLIKSCRGVSICWLWKNWFISLKSKVRSLARISVSLFFILQSLSGKGGSFLVVITSFNFGCENLNRWINVSWISWFLMKW